MPGTHSNPVRGTYKSPANSGFHADLHSQGHRREHRHTPRIGLFGAFLAFVLALLFLAGPTEANAHRGHSHSSSAYRAQIIKKVFGPRYGKQAVRVAMCESGLRPHARNGQYRGAFQMGNRERATYGHGRGMWKQARAAFRYFEASGRDWSPWQCKPWWRRR